MQRDLISPKLSQLTHIITTSVHLDYLAHAVDEIIWMLQCWVLTIVSRCKLTLFAIGFIMRLDNERLSVTVIYGTLIVNTLTNWYWPDSFVQQATPNKNCLQNVLLICFSSKHTNSYISIYYFNKSIYFYTYSWLVFRDVHEIHLLNLSTIQK